ncbi:MAG: ATP-binding protein [Ardenticatenaceae bacterium]|nr:ATP-binding protein [Ardenticatenaceae bacterium]
MKPDLSFQHLQLEFTRLDILIHRQVQQQGRSMPPAEDGSALLNLYHLSEAQAYELLQRPFGAGHSPLDEDADQPYAEALAQAEEQIAALVTHADETGQRLRLAEMAALLGLDRFALDAFLICLAPLLDPRYARLYGFLQDDLTRKRPSIHLILSLLAAAGPERLAHLTYFTDDAPLFQQRLLERLPEPGGERPLLISQTLAPDEGLATWLLLGQYQPHVLLKEHLTYEPNPAVDMQLLPPGTAAKLADGAEGGAVLILHGADEVAQQTAAAFLAQGMERSADDAEFGNGHAGRNVAAADAIRLLLRDALLTGALPAIVGWDSCLVENAPPPPLLTAICDYPDVLVVCGQARWQPRQVAERVCCAGWHFLYQKRGSGSSLCSVFGAGETAVLDAELAALSGQFVLTTGQLRDVVNTARDLAAQDGRPLQGTDLFAAARAHSNPRLETLARKISPRYDWADLILPDEQIAILREMVATIRSRPLVLEEWGVGKKLTASAGVTALFFGPPGTGKTMGAEILAGELGLDLYKIDLSSMVSKYIGETEKNLERIFNEAESSNAILFFDEADAIFGKRSEVKDAHDRYANIEISYLLQRMEAYDGVTILATNLRANLDDAFMRRLQFGIDFPFPKPADRLRIWQALFPPDVPRDANLDLELMAERFEIAGGNIRNILVTAAYLAASNGQVVKMEHLLHGTRRELQKMGRLVNERDLELV